MPAPYSDMPALLSQVEAQTLLLALRPTCCLSYLRDALGCGRPATRTTLLPDPGMSSPCPMPFCDGCTPALWWRSRSQEFRQMLRASFGDKGEQDYPVRWTELPHAHAVRTLRLIAGSEAREAACKVQYEREQAKAEEDYRRGRTWRCL